MILETNKTLRQYVSVFLAAIVYLVVHEGAHLLMALQFDVFKQVNFMSLGIQIDINKDALSEPQFIAFNFAGVLATLTIGYVLVFLTNRIVTIQSKSIKSIFYYITMALLLTDCIYLSALSNFFGGGDLNGIALFFNPNTQATAKYIFGSIGIINIYLFVRLVYPKYVVAFKK